MTGGAKTLNRRALGSTPVAVASRSFFGSAEATKRVYNRWIHAAL
jgi:hypothetical protein